jgi:hypothetical protein
VELNNSQINHITAHNSDNFFTILTNQSHKIEEVELNFSSKLLGVDSFAGKNLILLNEKGEVVKSIQNHGGNISLEIPCRGLRVAVIENVKVNVESQQKMPINEADIDNTYFTFPLKGANLKVGAAAIKVMPVKWDAYIWVNATPEQVNQIQFYYSIDGGASWEDFLDDEYPFELSIPVDSDEIELIFRVEGELLNAGKFKTTNKKLVSK